MGDINQENDLPIKRVVVYFAKVERSSEITYTDTKLLGNGSFGVVYRATLIPSNEFVAIKKMARADKRAVTKENRELNTMRTLNHQNIVNLLYYFYSKGNGLYSYQMIRAIAYLHSMGYCHRDIKPQNMLVDHEKGVLKLCDFGSSKFLLFDEKNVSYICSRYYRAPELIFGSFTYTHSVDVWSAGCVMGELLNGKPMFVGDNAVEQLVEIIKILGTPKKEEIRAMNENFADYQFPLVRGISLEKHVNSRSCSDSIQLLKSLLNYTPSNRILPIRALAHPFFDELRNPNCTLPNGRPLPPLFNFCKREFSPDRSLTAILIPQHAIQFRELVESEFDRTIFEEYYGRNQS